MAEDREIERLTKELENAKDDLASLENACFYCAQPETYDDPTRHHHEPEGWHWHHYLDPGDGLPSPCANSDLLERIVGEYIGETERLNALINTPHTDDFLKAVPIEAAHQIERWGTAHDEGKEPTDWLWLVGYLAGKAANAAIAGDLEKAKHHTISTSAVMLNWYRRLVGEDQTFQPGINAPDVEAPS